MYKVYQHYSPKSKWISPNIPRDEVLLVLNIDKISSLDEKFDTSNLLVEEMQLSIKY